MPPGYLVLRKIENIIRQEMDKIASELHMPILIPADLWIESERYNAMGAEMWRISDRHQKPFVLGPTHEEMIVDVVRSRQLSYLDLPIHLYQIQTKFRDEVRPRFGLMRAREFLMKDSYSFHTSSREVEEELIKAEKTYNAILNRLDLKFIKVDASSGAMGGNSSFEFQVLADSGEDEIIYCPHCHYASNREKATSKLDSVEGLKSKKQVVETKDTSSIDDLSAFFNISPAHFIKTLLYGSKDKYYAFLLRGDLDLNEEKIKLISDNLHPLTHEELAKLNIATGYVGPTSLDSSFVIIADLSIKTLNYQIIGAGKINHHIKGVVLEDYLNKISQFADIALAKAGQACPHCKKELESKRGIEVGHIFNLGTKYAKSLGLYFTDNQGQKKLVEMGCYGLGVSRLMAAVVEQKHDEGGIIFPDIIAPFVFNIIPVSDKLEEVASDIYQKLISAGIDVCYDDRPLRFGVKVKDSDLLGIPYKIVLGKALEHKAVEFKYRDGRSQEILLDDLVAFIKDKKHLN
jgi:prolyl-tRNA synthetase